MWQRLQASWSSRQGYRSHREEKKKVGSGPMKSHVQVCMNRDSSIRRGSLSSSPLVTKSSYHIEPSDWRDSRAVSAHSACAFQNIPVPIGACLWRGWVWSYHQGPARPGPAYDLLLGSLFEPPFCQSFRACQWVWGAEIFSFVPHPKRAAPRRQRVLLPVNWMNWVVLVTSITIPWPSCVWSLAL